MPCRQTTGSGPSPARQIASSTSPGTRSCFQRLCSMDGDYTRRRSEGRVMVIYRDGLFPAASRRPQPEAKSEEAEIECKEQEHHVIRRHEGWSRRGAAQGSVPHDHCRGGKAPGWPMSHPQESTRTAGAGLREVHTTAELLRIRLPRSSATITRSGSPIGGCWACWYLSSPVPAPRTQ